MLSSKLKISYLQLICCQACIKKNTNNLTLDHCIKYLKYHISVENLILTRFKFANLLKSSYPQEFIKKPNFNKIPINFLQEESFEKELSLINCSNKQIQVNESNQQLQPEIRKNNFLE